MYYGVPVYNNRALRDYLYHSVYHKSARTHTRYFARRVWYGVMILWYYCTYDLCHVYIRRRVISKYAAGTLRICLYIVYNMCESVRFLMKESSEVGARVYFIYRLVFTSFLVITANSKRVRHVIRLWFFVKIVFTTQISGDNPKRH